MSKRNTDNPSKFKAVINPPFTLVAFIYFMYFSLALAVWVAFDFTAAAIVMAALTVVMPIIWRNFRMVISVDDELRIDKAHIELRYLKEPVALDKESYRKLRTINSDARSFHATRPWLKVGVKVALNDPRDKTTYWLIGFKNTKSAEKFIEVLTV
ncbi:MAG: DUF3093 family protein [Candidatus Nanopelagicaceae bacterium]